VIRDNIGPCRIFAEKISHYVFNILNLTRNIKWTFFDIKFFNNTAYRASITRSLPSLPRAVYKIIFYDAMEA